MPERARAVSRPLRRRLAVMLGLAGAALALCLVLIVASLLGLTDSRRELVDRIDPAVVAARDLQAAVIDQETGMRGFVLVPDRAFLDPYLAGRSAETDSLARLHQLLDDEPRLSSLAAESEAAVARWRREVAEPTIAGVERGDTSVTTDEVQEAGRARFEELRADLDRLEAGLTMERQERSDNLASRARQVVTAVGALAATLVAVGLALVMALRRSITEPIERLSMDVRAVAAGDLHRTVEMSGESELAGLAVDVDAMRIRILDELARLREASAAVESQAEDLARSNTDLEQFAYVASHDLQEPLRKVAGFCQLLQRRYGGQLDERADEYIHYAVDGAQRMQQLINDLLAFSRVGRTTERFEPVDLGAAARRALAGLAASVEEHDATVELGDLPTVPGDARLLAAVFQNLVGNAIKFHRPGTAPHVVIAAEPAPNGATPPEVIVSVTDNGIGIDPRYGDQIFTLFKRLHTKSEYDGTGIGLALCKRIVEFHGGRIWLEPHDGDGGTTFVFTLPTDPTSKEPDRG